MAPWPLPEPLAEKIPGAEGVIPTPNASVSCPWYSTRMLTFFLDPTPYGTTTFTWVGPTYSSGAATSSKNTRVSFNNVSTSPSAVNRGPAPACGPSAGARMVRMAPGLALSGRQPAALATHEIGRGSGRGRG